MYTLMLIFQKDNNAVYPTLEYLYKISITPIAKYNLFSFDENNGTQKRTRSKYVGMCK